LPDALLKPVAIEPFDLLTVAPSDKVILVTPVSSPLKRSIRSLIVIGTAILAGNTALLCTNAFSFLNSVLNVIANEGPPSNTKEDKLSGWSIFALLAVAILYSPFTWIDCPEKS